MGRINSMPRLSLCLMIVVLSNCNIWDNIFSETLAYSPIIFSESLHFQFPYQYQKWKGDIIFDYNNKLKIITVAAQTIILIKIDAFRMQIDLQELIIIVSSPLLGGCKKYRPVLTDGEIGNWKGMNVNSKLFLINILFEYIGRAKNDKTMSEYLLMPDLIIDHKPEHEEYEQNILVVVDKNGAVDTIYEDKTKSKSLPFKLTSQIKIKKQCAGEVIDVTREEIYGILKKSIENKDYEKIPGFDNLPFPKDFDISKLPKIPL